MMKAIVTPVRVFVQARMSSKRFPGKVLAKLNGLPVLGHVVNSVADVLPKKAIVVVTSTDATDDPLAKYVESLSVPVFRGPLNNVVQRFQMCLKQYPCDWLFRICADSPLIDSGLISNALQYVDRQDVDVVTNVFPRTFPKGQSIEMIRSALLAGIDADRLTPEEQEHVTKHFYLYPGQFRIMNFESEEDLSDMGLTVDTPEDLDRLSRMFAEDGMRPRFLVRTS
jgi:spore coat polysaccharide biosynthesis protein SpsF (cytidylyltransferase family)